MKIEYKSQLPQGCPPSDSIDANGTFYRLAKSDPPNLEDFRSTYELRTHIGADECLRKGLSMFMDCKHLKNALKHNRNKKKYIVKLKLNPNDGKIKQTGKPSHHTFWPYKSFCFMKSNISIVEFYE